MVIVCDEKILLEKILILEEELSNINFERLKKALIYIKINYINSDDMYLIDDSLIDINNITGSNNFTLITKVNVKPYGYDKMYMDKDLIEDIDRRINRSIQ